MKHERDPLRVRPPVGTRLRSSATRSATSSTGSTPKGRRARRWSTTSRGTPRDYDYCLFFSYRYYHAYLRRARGRRTGDSRADRRARRDDRPVDLSAAVPQRPRDHVQLARRADDDSGGVGQRSGARRRRRRRLRRARATRSRGASVRSTTSADRSRSTSAASTRTRAARSCSTSSRAIFTDPHGKLSLVLDRQLAAADSRASADPPSRLPRRRRQVRRDGGRRRADHAVVLREPVDGGARSVGARPAGARQRQVRRAEGPVHSQQRRSLLRDAAGVHRNAARRSSRIAG